MVLWNGSCMVRDLLARKIVKLKERHPEALNLSPIRNVKPYPRNGRLYWKYDRAAKVYYFRCLSEYIVATEAGILHQMQLKSPRQNILSRLLPPINAPVTNAPYEAQHHG